MTTKNRRFALPVILAVVALVASCTLSQDDTSQPSPTVCDGVSSEAGGCTLSRHTYTSVTCQDLAEEWATVVDATVVGVLHGPAEVEGQGRSVLLRQVVVIATVDLNEHLRDLGLRGSCVAGDFVATAEPAFSEELRAGVGDALYDGLPPASYEEWLADVLKTVRIIED